MAGLPAIKPEATHRNVYEPEDDEPEDDEPEDDEPEDPGVDEPAETLLVEKDLELLSQVDDVTQEEAGLPPSTSRTLFVQKSEITVWLTPAR